MRLKEIKSKFSGIINYDLDPKRIYSKIITEASNEDLVLVTGSNFIAKELFNEK
jgi:hypothetical protein